MNWKRKKRKGVSQKIEKLWVSECGQYRITWASQVFGVSIPPCYHACVRVMRPHGDKFVYWNFCGKRGPYRKLNAAIQAAENHRKVWENALQITVSERKGRADRLRTLDYKARPGHGVFAGRILSAMPVWARKHEAAGRLRSILFPEGKKVEDDECELSQNDPTPTCSTSETKSPGEAVPETSSTRTQRSGRASPAKDGDESTTPTTPAAQSKETNSGTRSSARTAKGRDPQPRKRSAKRTTKRSKSTSRKSASTKRSRKPVAAA